MTTRPISQQRSSFRHAMGKQPTFSAESTCPVLNGELQLTVPYQDVQVLLLE